MQALQFSAAQQLDAAQDVLQQALLLAQPGGFIRTFVDLGQPMYLLLIPLVERGVAPAYLHRLHAAFVLANVETEPNDQSRTKLGVADESVLPASQLLTPRELEVLGLLDSPLTDKEIALRLFITVNTVKRHTGSIYQKLGVHNRRRAVSRAKNLQILTAPKPAHVQM